ncbi:reverse transcriptase domain-containing protein [Methylophaga sulfidovorans]|uniref:Group II intron reverse transcriptase/maturase n=1 Tax=Methylophaga sulfidovorans TaxID=45496 RepID=A0A1I3VS32_9GAMM|nr:reverse transcriptase domain-containing protein [Methylophaga sulfidovorans]SFJ98198.1 group II intron reverse transcriptase/maturase [Methylophaga sulfidovorans]
MYSSTPRKKRDASGIDGLSINDFDDDKDNYISLLSEKIRSGTYTPMLLRAAPIPKPNNKYRIICIPTVKDRFVQRCILRFLNNHDQTLANKISYGFINGYSKAVECAVTKAKSLRQSQSWAYKADISAFFDNIQRAEIENLIRKKVKYRSLHNLIIKFVHTEIQADGNLARIIHQQGISRGLGLRQGMPLSPYLANLYLKNFDDAVIKKNIKMIRYADDLIAFANNKDSCHQIHDFCKQELRKVFLDIHDIDLKSKTIIAAPEQDIEFLGLSICPSNSGYEIPISQQQLGKIKTKLYELTDMNYCLKNGINLTNIMSKLESKKIGYMDAYDSAQNKSQLHDLLDNSYRQIIGQIFFKLGINIDKLPSQAKKFLGLHLI